MESTTSIPVNMSKEEHQAGHMSRRITAIITSCLICISISGIGALTMGDTVLTIPEVLQALGTSGDSFEHFIVVELRLPRFLTGLLVGAALGMAGTIVQSITRNPLGTPDLMGVSAGASFAIVVGFVMFSLPPSAMLLLGTTGGFVAGLLTFAIAWKTQLNPLHLTLSGMSIGLFFMAGITLLLITASADANGIYYWLAGSLMNTTWQHTWQLFPFVVAGLAMGISFARPLNLLMLDDITSRSLGMPVNRWRFMLGLTAVILTAATVAVAGPVSFVGLVAPHTIKLLLKKSTQQGSIDHRILLPLSALMGASLVCLADWIAKYQEVPVGILCILVGGPLFVYLIRKKNQ